MREFNNVIKFTKRPSFTKFGIGINQVFEIGINQVVSINIEAHQWSNKQYDVSIKYSDGRTDYICGDLSNVDIEYGDSNGNCS